MEIRRWRTWLTWLPPVAVAAVLLVALGQAGSGSGEEPVAAAGAPSGDTTSTTAFFERIPTLPDEPFDYTEPLPAHFADAAAFDSSPEDNPVTDTGATLGRVLFHDVNLSRNRTVRCASCHVQVHSFTDPLTLSQGLNGFRTRRNSMSLANAAFNPSGRYLWDEDAATLEQQVLMPFEDQLEMDLPVEAVVARIEERPFYGPLFTDAFGDPAVTPERVSFALAQFIRSMVSAESRYDEGRAQVASPEAEFPNFTEEENRGKTFFLTARAAGGGGCASCHATDAHISTGLENNGIDPPTAQSQVMDLGAFEPTGDPSLVGAFRVPSLRNVEVTGPYMHDGRLDSLELVIEHYSRGVQPHENLSPELRGPDGQPFTEPFTNAEADALLAFLKTLTDESFLADERFAEPFRSGGP